MRVETCTVSSGKNEKDSDVTRFGGVVRVVLGQLSPSSGDYGPFRGNRKRQSRSAVVILNSLQFPLYVSSQNRHFINVIHVFEFFFFFFKRITQQ